MPENNDWKPISVIAERPATKGTMEVITRSLTDTARIASSRQAAGVASVLDFGGPSGSSIPGILATNSPIAAFLYTISRADKLSLFRYWCFINPETPITMDNEAEKPLCEIESGDRVINALGGVIEVNQRLIRDYEGDVIGIDLGFTEAGRDLIEVTSEHPFWVVRGGKVGDRESDVNPDPEWINAGDLEEGDFLVGLKTEGMKGGVSGELGYGPVGSRLMPIKSLRCRYFKGQVFNIETNGKTYDEQSFLAHGFATHNCTHDAMVGRAIELHSELPMSRITIGPPKGPSPRQNRQITRIYESMSERLDIMGLMLEISREYWMCFHPDSLVTLEGDKYKKISEVKVGDLVLTSKNRFRKVDKVHRHWVEEEIYILSGDGLKNPIRATSDHKLITKDGEIRVRDVRVGSTINSLIWSESSFSYQEDSVIMISDIERVYYRGDVYDLTVEEDHTYVVENACVHNCGDVYVWLNWSDKLQQWDDAYVLPVEFAHSLMHPFNRKKEIIFFAKPLVDTAAVRRITDRDMYMVCFLPGTGITLRDGTQRNIEDMKEGDVVLSGDGNYQKVLAVGGRDIDEEIAVISARGLRDDLYVTLNHKLHTNRGRIPAGEVQEGDFLLAAPDHSEIPCEDLNDRRVWLAGWFAAEGSLRRTGDSCKGEVTIVFNAEDEESFARQCRDFLELEFEPEIQQELSNSLDWKELIKGKTERWKNWEFDFIDEVAFAGYSGQCTKCGAPNHYLRLKSTLSKTGERLYECRVCKAARYLNEKKSIPRVFLEGSVWKVVYSNRKAYEFFKTEVRSRSENKKFHERWLTLPKRQQQILWDTYFEGDGTRRKAGGRSATSISPDLRDQIYWISARLGYNPRTSSFYEREPGKVRSIHEYESRFITEQLRGTKVRKPDYKIDITSFSISGRFTDSMDRRRQEEPVVEGKVWMRVLGVARAPYTGRVHNICVDSDHTYHANGAAVNNSDTDIEKLYEALGDTIPPELKEALNYGEAVPLNTNWRRGSYCVHIARNRAPNEEYGQCAAQGTRVLTSEGYLKIEDYVNLSTGKIHTEYGSKDFDWVQDNGVQDTMTITTRTGNKLRVTPTHSFRVMGEDGIIRWKKGFDLWEGEYILCQRGDGGLIPEDRGEDPSLWEAAGLLWGDGSQANLGDQHQWGIPEGEEETLDWLKVWLNSQGYTELKGRCFPEGERNCMGSDWVRIPYEEEKIYRIHEIPPKYTELRKSTKKMYSLYTVHPGLNGVLPEFAPKGTWRSDGFPEIFWKQGKKQMAAFLRGLFSTDGSCGKGQPADRRISYCNKYESVIRDAKRTLLLFGIVSTIFKRVDPCPKFGGDGVSWHLRLLGHKSNKLFKKKIGFLLDRKNQYLEDCCDLPDRNQRTILGYPHATELVKKIFPSNFYRSNRKQGKVLFSGGVGATISSIRRGKQHLLADTMIEKILEKASDCGQDKHAEALLLEYQRNDWWFDRVDKIEKSEPCRVYDPVNTETKSYVSEGIISHNSLIERCMDTLLRLENLKNANLQISSRNMNPKHIVTAPGTGKQQMEDLRAQIDLSMLEQVDYPIVCVMPDSHVRVEDGTTKRIDQIQVGDQVRTQQGNIRNVDYVHKNPHYGIMYEIYARGLNTPIRITGNHPFFTNKGDVQASEIQKDDILLYQPYSEEREFSDINENRAYLMGWYAAEGFVVGDRDTVIFCLNPSKEYDQDAIKDIMELLEIEFEPEYRFFSGVEVSGRDAKVLNRVRYNEAGPTAAKVSYTNRKASKFFSEECPGKSSKKKLSNRWMVAKKEIQRWVLNTWMRGDGSIDQGNFSCNGVSFSVDLRDQMYDLAARLGINSYPYVCMDNRTVDEVFVRQMTLEERLEHRIQFRLLIGSYDARTKLWMMESPKPKVDFEAMRVEYQELGLSGGSRVEWSHERDQFVIKYYNLVKTQDLADCMGITARALRVRATRLKLRKKTSRGENEVTETGALTLKVEFIKQVMYEGYVYNLDVRDDHTYIVENACVRNCNFEVNWQTVGANDRLLNTENEYNLLRQDLALGLGSTVEMLTGQSSYSGNRVTLEVMNTMYLTFRDKIRKFVEEDIFRPVADALGHYQKEFIDVWPRVEPEEIEEGDILSEEEDGQLRRKRVIVNVLWNHSTLRFNRISIRDNAEVYDQLFQLYQKGSLAVRYLLDLHNIDPEENARAILEDIGGPKDPVFNDFVRAVYTSTDMPQKILNDTDFMQRIIEGLKLKYKPISALGAGGGGGGIGGGGGLSDMGGISGGEMGGEFGGPMGMPGEEGGMFGAPGGAGVPGGEMAPGGPGGAPGGPGGAPGGVPAPAASRRSAEREGGGERSESIAPGRILPEDISLVVGRALRERSEEVERMHGRSLTGSEIRNIIKAIEIEDRRRKSAVHREVSKNNGRLT
jgi:intein/homing endonuclease